MIWRILGIEQTEDRQLITEAYRARLRTTNPEDDPEGFKALRQAYEEALRLIERPRENTDDSPVGLWLQDVKAVYDDFQRRIDPGVWTELFSRDVMTALDLRPLAEEALFRFLMDYWRLPQKVWQLIVDTFSVEQRLDEFYSAYAKDFIDYAVLNGAHYPGPLPYELFTPGRNGADCDRYIALYNETNGCGDRLPELLEQMDELSEHHPYGDAIRCRDMLGGEHDGLARRELKALADTYPEVSALVMVWVNLCCDEGNWPEVGERTKRLLDADPDNYTAGIAYARFLFAREDYEEAKDLLYRFHNHLPAGDPVRNRIITLMQEWNETIIGKLADKPDRTPKESEELAWCYLQNDRYEEAAKAAEGIREEELSTPYDYHNLLAKVSLGLNDQEKALYYLQQVSADLETLEEITITEDMTAEEVKEAVKSNERRARRAEFAQLESDCLFQLDRKEEGEALLNQLLERYPDNQELRMRLGHLAYDRKDYRVCVEHMEKCLAINMESPLAHFLLSLGLYQLGNDGAAFDEVNRALNMDGSQLPYYVHKLNILIRNHIWEEAHELLNYLKECGLEDHIIPAYFEAVLMEEEKEDHKEALKLFRGLEERLKAGETMSIEESSRVFYYICLLEGNDRDPERQEDMIYLQAILDQGLSYDPSDVNCLYYKGWLFKQARKTEEALKIMKQLESYPIHSFNVERNLAQIYYQNLSRYAREAYHYYNLQLERDPDDPALYFYLGTCCRYLGDYDQGKAMFRKELELDKDDADAYKGLSYLYECEKDYVNALDMLDHMLSMTDKAELKSEYYYRRHRLYCRLGYPKEALQALEDSERCHDSYYYNRARFKVYTMYGMWSQADRLLKSWKKSGEDMKAFYDRSFILSVMKEDFRGAEKLLDKFGSRMNEEDLAFHRYELACAREDYAFMLTYWQNRLKEGGDITHALFKLALIYAWIDNREKQVSYAKEAVEKLLEEISKSRSSETLYRSRLVVAYYLAGETDKAVEEMNRTRHMRLCDHCNERYCKDLDIFAMYLKELEGDLQGAMALAREGLRKCPDETDFIIHLRRMKKKEARLR